jgi:glycerol-3-phosphate dehydrogenase
MSQALLTRADTLTAMQSPRLDLLIIGGGIVGSGIARDAAMRGLRVGLVEQYDFAFGTSSRSSRLLHGGLRYLAQGRLGLVREASLEKRTLQHIAPHLAAPLPFLFPTRAGDRQWALWKLKIGVKLYDALCGWRNLGRSEWLSAEETRARLPMLNPAKLSGAVRYFDGLTSDARLVLDTLRSAQRHGALLASRVRFAAARQDGALWRVELADLSAGRQMGISARWIVNAGGPWAAAWPQSRLKLRLTKGVHVVVDQARLPVPDAVVLTDERRILFAIPWGRRTIIGTTDTDYEGPIESVRCEMGDVQYLLGIVNSRFPAAALQHHDVLATWAGLRPLVATRSGHPSDASRSHDIRKGEGNWLDVAGGKLTTYRLIAEQAVDRVARALRWRFSPCRTATEPLLEAGEAEGVSSIVPEPPTQRAVEHYCRREWASTLEDVMVRRSSWHYYEDDTLAVAHRIAPWMQQVLGWDEARLQEELEAYKMTLWQRGKQP